MEAWSEYAWIIVVGALTAFFMAFGIGANDSANAFSTSVGSKTITLLQAVIIACIFEFLGAVLLGRGVTDTITSGIVDHATFQDTPDVFMYGMFCALMASALWLMVATMLQLPVSTAHSISGGVIGMGLVAHGSKAVSWHEVDTSGKFPIKGVSAILLSWILSPVLSGIVAAAFFWIARTFVLRHDDAYDRVFWCLPGLVCICAFINALYVLDRGIDQQWGYTEGRTGRSAKVAAIVAVVLSFFSIFWAMILKKKLQMRAEAEAARIKALEAEEASDSLELRIPSAFQSCATADGERGQGKDASATSGSGDLQVVGGFFARIGRAINSNDPHSAAEVDVAVHSIHEGAEIFEDRTEGIFRYLQVLTAICESFAHGSNDVANYIGPFSAMWAVYRDQNIRKSIEVPIWMLPIVVLGIVIGLAMYGYKIIQVIGVKLAKITPSRGVAIELGSALVVATGSYYGMPLSTTHCQVGATVAVGLLEGTGGVSWRVIGSTAGGWVLTLVVAGGLSAVMMALGVYSPNLNSANAIAKVKGEVNTVSMDAADALQDVCGSDTEAVMELLDARGFFQQATARNVRFPLRVADAVSYMGQLSNSMASSTPCDIPPVSQVFPISQNAEFDFVEEDEERRKTL